MVNRSYPRYGSVTKLPPNGKGSNKRCIPGCLVVEMQEWIEVFAWALDVRAAKETSEPRT